MSKRRLMVEVDCGGKRCKRCDHMAHGPEAHCEVFVHCDDNDLDAKGRPLRLPACLAAERDAAPLVDAETLEAWEELARSGAGYQCANALSLACKILRRQHEPAEIPAATQVDHNGTTTWSAPLVFTFEGKVKP